MRKGCGILSGALIGEMSSWRCFLRPCVSRRMSRTKAAIDPKRGRVRGKREGVLAYSTHLPDHMHLFSASHLSQTFQRTRVGSRCLKKVRVPQRVSVSVCGVCVVWCVWCVCGVCVGGVSVCVLCCVYVCWCVGVLMCVCVSGTATLVRDDGCLYCVREPRGWCPTPHCYDRMWQSRANVSTGEGAG